LAVHEKERAKEQAKGRREDAQRKCIKNVINLINVMRPRPAQQASTTSHRIGHRQVAAFPRRERNPLRDFPRINFAIGTINMAIDDLGPK